MGKKNPPLPDILPFIFHDKNDTHVLNQSLSRFGDLCLTNFVK